MPNRTIFFQSIPKYFIYQLLNIIQSLTTDIQMRSQESVECYCQQTIKQSQLKGHLKYCQKYQGVALSKIRMINKDTKIMVLKLFNAELQLCQQIIKEWIKKSQINLKRQIIIDHQPVQAWINQISDYQALFNGIDNRKRPQIQEIRYPTIPNGANIANNYLGLIKKQVIRCKMCSKSLDTWVDEAKIFTKEQCFHKFCRACIKKYVQQQFLNKSGDLTCPEKQCRKKISQKQLKQILGETKLQQMQNRVIKKIMNIVSCVRCHYQFQFLPGKIQQSPIFDKNYYTLNEEQKRHYANNRFICPSSSCKLQQCKQCRTTPYHLGETCRQSRFNKQKTPSPFLNKQRNCRVCLKQINLQNSSNSIYQALNDICKGTQCQQIARQACTKTLPCGHNCPGIRGEQACLPCLKYQCCKNNAQLNGQKGLDNCKLCQKYQLSRLPCIRSVCGHFFHEKCIKKRIQSKWKTEKISFNFCLCPICKKWLTVPKQSLISSSINCYLDLFNKLQYLSVERLRFQGRTKDRALVEPSSQFYKNQYTYSMTLYAYYECFNCKKPYFGGMKSNQGEQNSSTKLNQLICPSCCNNSFEGCEKHGKNFIDYKCKFCCSIGVWYYNRAHYCQSCYKVKQYISKLTKQKLPLCQGEKKCQIGGHHAGNGDQKILRCSACRNLNQK